MRFKLFDDVELNLVGRSLKHLGRGKFYYSANINGMSGSLSLSYVNGLAVGNVMHKGNAYEVGTWKKGLFYVVELEEPLSDFKCDIDSNEENTQELKRPKKYVGSVSQSKTSSVQNKNRKQKKRNRVSGQNIKQVNRNQVLSRRRKSLNGRQSDKFLNLSNSPIIKPNQKAVTNQLFKRGDRDDAGEGNKNFTSRSIDSIEKNIYGQGTGTFFLITYIKKVL